MKDFLLESKDKSDSMRFGVIDGPLGTGKRYAMRKVCNEFPEGMLYYEVVEPYTFVSGLGQEIGMKFVPTTVFDLILSYISPSYIHYHVLPQNQSAGLNKVMLVLGNAATMYTKEHGNFPVVFIFLPKVIHSCVVH